ncbi:MAG: DUF1573 domain-containing protein [Planctomycetaceae bacterium]|nr:DUF1573 domain-containing protein [Planctomycetaceae bacterium]
MDEPHTAFQSRNSALIVFLLGLAPAVAALFLSSRAPAGRSFEPATVSSFAFDQFYVNRGKVEAQAKIEFHFGFENRGDKPVRFVEIKPSCGCLQPRLIDERHKDITPQVIRPGTRGEIYVAVATATEAPGNHQYSVEVTYDDGTRRTETLRFKLDIPEQKVLVEPSQLLFYQLSGTADSRDIIVTDARGGDLKILSAELSQPLEGVELQINDRRKSKDGFWESAVSVNVAGDVPVNRQIAYVVLNTDDADFPVLRVPIMVEGWNQSTQPSQPAQLTAPALPSPR